MQSESISIVNHWLTSIDGIKWVSEGCTFFPMKNIIWESTWDFIQLTLLIMYNDGLCSLCYTTNLLKDGCLASIGSSYDKNAKVGTSVLLPAHGNIMCNCKETPGILMEVGQYFDSLDTGIPAVSAIIDVFSSMGIVCRIEGGWKLETKSLRQFVSSW